jgi:hypothetical protein
MRQQTYGKTAARNRRQARAASLDSPPLSKSGANQLKKKHFFLAFT